MRGRTMALVMAVGAATWIGCGRDGRDGEGEGGRERTEGDARVDEGLGTLKVMNQASEPVAIYLDGREIYSVPPGRSYTFRNLPLGEVNLYGVGRVSERHYGLPVITIEEGEDYEWMIQP